MRIDKLLGNMGFGSRKDMKKLLKSGSVKVDGVIVKDGKFQVEPHEQEVTVHGEVVVYQQFIYLMMNKPQGVISATEDNFQSTVIDLLSVNHAIFEPFPVGRLDKDTEGLLLLTNDGSLAHQLLSPKKHVPKKYFARVEGEVTKEDVTAFKQGVVLDDGYQTKSGELTIITSGEQSEIELIITEGKFHQVKRMFAAVGKKVVYLKRLEMGTLRLDDSLALGEYRELTDVELASLQR